MTPTASGGLDLSPPPAVQRVDLTLDEEAINTGVDELCARTSDAVHKARGSGPADRSGRVVNMAAAMLTEESAVRAPCVGKATTDRCDVVFEGATMAGMCSVDFVQGVPEPLCIPGEVLVAPHSCQGIDEPVGSACSFSMLDDTYRGVCSHDPSGEMKGCLTETAARFLVSLQNVGSTGFPAVPATVAVEGGQEYYGVSVRRHGGGSLMAQWEIGNHFQRERLLVHACYWRLRTRKCLHTLSAQVCIRSFS